jgi:hypothetical protein
MKALLLVPGLMLTMLFAPTVPARATLAAAPAALQVDGRQFLEYDTAGDGLAVEAVGDLDRATHVAILIPGVDTKLANFDTGLGGVRMRAPAFWAQQLYGQMQAVNPLEPVAVIAWLGYDTPNGIGLDAIREDKAAQGAAALDTFVADLTAQHPGIGSITVVGHSYGSVVAGLAAPGLGPRVKNIIAIGSPGMGVKNAAQLHTGAKVYAGTAPSDWTKWIPGVRLFGAGHGTHPTDRSFGALPLPVAGVQGHDGYFVSGTASLRAMAELALR